MTSGFGALGSYSVGSPGGGHGDVAIVLILGAVLLLLYGASLYGKRGGTFTEGLAAAYLGLASLVSAALVLGGAALMLQSLLLFVSPVQQTVPVPLMGYSCSQSVPAPGGGSFGTFIRPPVPVPSPDCTNFKPSATNAPNVDPGPVLAHGLGLFIAGVLFLVPHAMLWRARPRLRAIQPVRSQLGGTALVVTGVVTLMSLLGAAGGLMSVAIYATHLTAATYHAIAALVAVGPVFGYLLMRAYPLTGRAAPPAPEPATPAPRPARARKV